MFCQMISLSLNQYRSKIGKIDSNLKQMHKIPAPLRSVLRNYPVINEFRAHLFLPRCSRFWSLGLSFLSLGVGVRFPVGSSIFSSPRRPDRLWGPPSLLSNGYRALSAGVNRPGREACRSPPTSAEVRKIWIYTSTLL
jgi:hypothetical protein